MRTSCECSNRRTLEIPERMIRSHFQCFWPMLVGSKNVMSLKKSYRGRSLIGVSTRYYEYDSKRAPHVPDFVGLRSPWRSPLRLHHPFRQTGPPLGPHF